MSIVNWSLFHIESSFASDVDEEDLDDESKRLIRMRFRIGMDNAVPCFLPIGAQISPLV